MNKGDLMNQVYQSELTKRATLVMFYLINRADKEMTCFPGIKTIARECGISSRTVQRALNDLEEAGFVKKESRYHEQGGQRSNLYVLVLEEKKEEPDNKISFEDYRHIEMNEEDSRSLEPSKHDDTIGGVRIESKFEKSKISMLNRFIPMPLRNHSTPVMEGWSG